MQHCINLHCKKSSIKFYVCTENFSSFSFSIQYINCNTNLTRQMQCTIKNCFLFSKSACKKHEIHQNNFSDENSLLDKNLWKTQMKSKWGGVGGRCLENIELLDFYVAACDSCIYIHILCFLYLRFLFQRANVSRSYFDPSIINNS